MTDMERRPLVPPSPEERNRILKRQPIPQCLDEEDSPSPCALTPAERLAARMKGPTASEKESALGPLIPAKWAAVAAAVATALGAAAAFAPQLQFLPPWAPFALWALAAVAALLAGVAIPEYKGGPLASPAAVPIILAASMGLKTFATQLAPGAAQNIVLLLSLILDALAGKAIPQPMLKPDRAALLR